MHIRLSRTELLRALGRVQGIVEKKQISRTASQVLIEAGGSTVKFSATDSDISMTAQYDAEVLKPGAVAAQARQLYDIARSLPAEDVVIEAAAQHWLNITCGNSKFHVAGGAADEFPALFEVEGPKKMPLSAATCLQMIDRTLFCASNDENRINLAGVFCEATPEGRLRMVSTDGHRLALAEGEAAEASSLGEGVLVPKKGLAEARRLLAETHGEGEVVLGVHSSGLVFECNKVMLTTRLINAPFPNYRQVIPQSSSKQAYIARGPFVEALKRVSLLSQSRTWGVRHEFSAGELLLIAEDPENGDAREKLSIEYEGDALNIGFNARYILDALQLMNTSRVQFSLTDEHSPGVLRPAEDESFLSIVMPMRV